MEIKLNSEKTKGFFLDNENKLKIPMYFIFNKAIPKQKKILFSAMVRYKLNSGKEVITDDDLADILPKIELKMNQDLLTMLDWLQKRKYIVIQGF